MLDLNEVNRVVDGAAAATLTRSRISRVFSTPMTDSQGDDALEVTIVLSADHADDVDGDGALATIGKVQRDLQDAGEMRFAIVTFATEDELEPNGNPES
jgi:hypothetical protein